MWAGASWRAGFLKNKKQQFQVRSISKDQQLIRLMMKMMYPHKNEKMYLRYLFQMKYTLQI